MVLLCKNKALYVKCCIIQNGVPDTQGDILDSQDIKKIFTSFNNQDNFEIHHNNLPISEVSLLENYISTNEENIAGTLVPAGSWNAVVRVDNPEIKSLLMDNVFGGVSLNNRVKTECSAGLTGIIPYNILKDAECVIPVLISFVEEPANGVGLHIMDYNVYIQKSKNVRGKSMSLLDDLKALIQKAESESDSDSGVSIVKEAEPVEPANDEEVVVGTEEAVIEKEAEPEPEEEKETVDDEESVEEEEEEVVEIEKATDDEESSEETVEDRLTRLEEAIIEIRKIIEPATEEETDDEEVAEEEESEEVADTEVIDQETNPVKDDEPIITKSAKITVTDEPVKKVKNYYEMTNRDPLTGKKL